MSALREAWLRRSPKERFALAALGAFVAFVLVAAFAWLPLERARQASLAQLPALRASLAALERDAREVQRLRALPKAEAGAAAQPLASLATNAGGLAGAQITVIDAKRVRLVANDVAFTGLLEWLRNAQATHRMRVALAHLEALPAPGRVKGELTLEKD